MTNNLVVIINSLKYQKLRKVYYMKFLVPNYSCLQNPWLGATAPRSPFSLSSVLNWICWTPSPRKKFLVTPLVNSAIIATIQFTWPHNTINADRAHNSGLYFYITEQWNQSKCTKLCRSLERDFPSFCLCKVLHTCWAVAVFFCNIT
jgi:hypothetical protein